MKLAQLEVFYSVIKSGSISQAARRMHLTQPALSLQIRDLEEYFQVKLLERTSTGIKPTPAGELVFSYGQKLVTMKDTLRVEIKKLQNECKLIQIGAGCVGGNYALPSIIYHFKEKYPEAEIRLTIDGSRKILEKLLEGNLDIAIVEGPLSMLLPDCREGQFSTTLIGYDCLAVVAAPSAFPQNKDSVEIAELKTLPMIMCENGSGVRAAVEKALHELAVEPSKLRIVLELNSLEAIKAFLAAGYGVAILPRLAVIRELKFGLLKDLELNGPAQKIEFSLVCQRRKFQSPLCRAFTDFICSAGNFSFGPKT